jgi:hypothetical protein
VKPQQQRLIDDRLWDLIQPVVTLEPVERLVQVGEEGAVLRVDRVGRHRHYGNTTPPLDRPAHPRTSACLGQPTGSTCGGVMLLVTHGERNRSC